VCACTLKCLRARMLRAEVGGETQSAVREAERNE